MAEHTLGPNGGMLYAMEYLEANFDWLEEGLERLRQEEEERWKVDGDGGGSPPPPYFIFDTPGQVELWTNHESLKRIVNRLVKQDYRVSIDSTVVCLRRLLTIFLSPFICRPAGSPSPLRRPLHHRTCQIHLRPPPCPPRNVTDGAAPCQRTEQDGSLGWIR